jgi:hypothetical protein
MMTFRPVFSVFVVALSTVAAASACSSSDSPSGQTKQGTGTDGGSGTPDAATPDGAMPGADSGGRPVDAFNGDCSTARWAGLSDSCWSCLCGACKPTLDKCNQDCMSILQCAFDNHTLVNKGTDLSCELTATTVTCLKDPKAQVVATPLINFDTCLIGATTKHAGEFRACDTECNVPYSGDVCTRFPPAKM